MPSTAYGMLWPGIGFARPSVPNLPMRGPRISAPASAGERALVVDDRRAGEVLHAVLEQPAVRAPDPVRDDRVREREPDAEGEVDPELRPLGHRAPDDRERDAGEDDLEQVAGGARDLREPVERRLADRGQLVDRREEARPCRRGRCRRRTRCRSRPPSRRSSRSPKMRTFLPAMWPAFFIRVRPASRKAKPACMNITSTAVMTTQIVDCRDQQIVLRHRLHLLEALLPVRLCMTFSTGVVQHEPVARLVAAARRVDDRGDRPRSTMSSATTKIEQRLRQEPRLEDAAAVLVRDAALAAVADRLDHRHADVAGRVLDGVDHRLDALTDDDRFDLVHRHAATASATSPTVSAGTVWIVCRIRPAIRYGSPSEFGRRSSR